jgi:starch-binding outer membrane protein, SusD/RagB family
MKKITIIFLGLYFISLFGCKRKLEIEPKGVLNEEQVSTPDGAEKFVIAAYSPMGNGDINTSFSLWQYANVRADDAYKGGRDEGDGQEFHFMETFTNMHTAAWPINGLWTQLYFAVARTNAALRTINKFDETIYPLKKVRQGEMRFLRGHYYFMLKVLFRNIPYIDETVAADDYAKISNREFTNDQLWEKIASDFTFASENLPVMQTQIGRPNQIAAYAYLAKTRLYQAYTQDDKYNVIGINQQRLQEVVNAADKVIASKYKLETDFANNFLSGSYENGIESIFAVQFSQNDNTLYGRLNFGDALNVPQGLGCCDFHKPSQNLVNSFNTSNNGLPLLDDFNSQDVNLSLNSVDPRLDHTVAIPGHSWKYEPKRIYKESWSRNPGVYGVYASLKENVSPDCDCFKQTPPFFPNSKNKILIRYADVLLMKAEALVELSREMEALPLINQLRERANNSTKFLNDANGNPQAIYRVEIYKPGININWTNEVARKAVRFERRIELAMEAGRFFDLVRWGVAAETINNYFAKEKTKRPFFGNANFTKNKNEYLPIPESQMNFSRGAYTQNIGY